MGVVSELDCGSVDGFHVMMTVAAFNQHLPIMLVTGPDPSLVGAVDAVEELTQLDALVKWPRLP